MIFSSRGLIAEVKDNLRHADFACGQGLYVEYTAVIRAELESLPELNASKAQLNVIRRLFCRTLGPIRRTLMKLIYGAAIVAGVAFSAPASVQAAVYAAHLEMVDNGNGTYNLNYRLNEDANEGVTINIMGPAPAQTIVRTYTFPSQTRGPQSVVWDGRNSLNVAVADGQYTWEVIASSNTSGNMFVKDPTVGSEVQHTFFQPYGLDFDKTTTSPHFGKLYVTNNAGTVTASGPGRVTTDGVYVLSNDFQDITGQGASAYGGGVSWGTTSSPFRVHVAPDGDVFISDWSDSNSGVWVMNPDDPTEPFVSVLDNSTRNPLGLAGNHGSISGMYVEGTGEDRVLYVLDEDFYLDEADLGTTTAQLGSIWAHYIGAEPNNYASSPTLIYNDALNGNRLVYGFMGEIIKDPHPSRGGWFISQYRWADEHNVFHFDGTEVDWSSRTEGNLFAENSLTGSIDISDNGNLIAGAGYSWIRVYDIADIENPVEVFVDGGAFNSHDDIVFDPAGNIVVGSRFPEQILYYSRTGDNTFTTPNPEGGEIIIGASSVKGWELY
jgi:hypothetical protein